MSGSQPEKKHPGQQKPHHKPNHSMKKAMEKAGVPKPQRPPQSNIKPKVHRPSAPTDSDTGIVTAAAAPTNDPSTKLIEIEMQGRRHLPQKLRQLTGKVLPQETLEALAGEYEELLDCLDVTTGRMLEQNEKIHELSELIADIQQQNAQQSELVLFVAQKTGAVSHKDIESALNSLRADNPSLPDTKVLSTMSTDNNTALTKKPLTTTKKIAIGAGVAAVLAAVGGAGYAMGKSSGRKEQLKLVHTPG